MNVKIVVAVVWLTVCFGIANFILPDASLIFFGTVSVVRAAIFALVYVTPLFLWFLIDTKKRRVVRDEKKV